MLTDRLESLPLLECRPAEGVAAFNAVYSGYLVPLAMTVERFERRFRAEDVDPFASRVWLDGGRPVAMLLVARRGRVSRLAAVGVVPDLRGRGLGRAVCAQGVSEARVRGDTHVWLEVFEANAPARALYRGLGFRDHSRLLGFAHPGSADPSAAPAAEVALAEGIALGARHAPRGGLPWMIERATLAAATAEVRCFADPVGGPAAFIDGEGPEVRLVGLLGAAAPSRARGFMDAVLARHPGRPWRAPPLYPEDLAAPFFGAAGWTESELAQVRMVLDLSASRG